jgi:hypothetical protein
MISGDGRRVCRADEGHGVQHRGLPHVHVSGCVQECKFKSGTAVNTQAVRFNLDRWLRLRSLGRSTS